MTKIQNKFPRFMWHAVEGPCIEGHFYTECGMPLYECPTCKRHGEEEKKMTRGNKGMYRKGLSQGNKSRIL